MGDHDIAFKLFMTLIVYVANFFAIVAIVFFRRKQISASYAWIMVLIFLPVVGFVLYYFFGSTMRLETLSRCAELDSAEEEYMNELKSHIKGLQNAGEIFEGTKMAEYHDMILSNALNAGSYFTVDNNVKLLINGQEKFPMLFEEMKKAEKSICVSYFIFKTHDEIGKEFLKILEDKAAEGVEVRLIYDGLGCLKTRMKDFSRLVSLGGKVQRFMPSMIRTLITANYRLHRKMVIIDGNICYTGGINVGDDYLGRYSHITPWRDTSVRFTGSSVRDMTFIFLKDWIFCAKQNRLYRDEFSIPEHVEKVRNSYFPVHRKEGNMACQVIEGEPTDKHPGHRDSYFKIVTSAKKYLYIQTPYFVPDEGLMDAVRIAARSGVDVRVMIPGIADKAYVYKVTLSFVQDLLEAGARVYRYNGFIHSKTIVADDFITSVGTTNFDIRSFKLDYEVNLLTYDRDLAVQSREVFLKDIEDSEEIIYEEFMKRGAVEYLLESIFRFFAPLY